MDNLLCAPSLEVGPRRRMTCAAGALSIPALLAVLASPAQAAPPRYPDILPLSRVHAGMTGYGLTTFKGTTISRFAVKVIGILKKENAGHDLILIRMKGGPITERGANLIHGMSGSPIYLDGKVAGAFSMGESFPKEPVGMVTPIEDMLEAWDPNIPQKPRYFMPAHPAAPGSNVIDLAHPLQVGSRRIDRLVIASRMRDPRQSSDTTAVLRPASTMLSVNGLSERDRAWLQGEIDHTGLNVTVAAAPISGGESSSFKGAPLRPGSAFGTFLATGDVEMGGTGTVTYRRGNRILGFGHPLMGIGATEAAITSAYIVDIFSGLETSHHIAIPGPVVGTLEQDRDFSVSAEVGRTPHLVPFDVEVRDETTHRTHTYHSAIFEHPELTAVIMRLVARECVERAHDVPGDVMARVKTSIDAAEVGRVERTNTVFDADDLGAAIGQDLTDITSLVSGNPFYPLPIRSGRISVDITAGHDTASVDRIFLQRSRFEPGDDVQVGVVVRPYRQAPITRYLKLRIPGDTPSGRYLLSVRGGSSAGLRIGPFVLATGSPDPEPPAVNVKQLLDRLDQREHNTDVVARLLLNTVAPALAGEKLSSYPPNLAALMRSERDSGVAMERDEVKLAAPTDYVLSGSQQLLVTVVRKNTQELPAGGFGSPGATGTPPPGLLAGLSDTPPFRRDEDEDPARRDDGAQTQANAPRPALGTEAQRWADELQTTGTLSARQPNQGAFRVAPPPTPPGASTPPPTKSPPASLDSHADTTADKPVGRQPQTWKQSAADFGRGQFDAASVTDRGSLRVSPMLKLLATTNESYIWSLVADQSGTLYAGTGSDGKVLRIDRTGAVQQLAKLPDATIQSLVRGPDGVIWAGSGVNGDIYRIRKQGKAELVCTLPDRYIVGLARDSAGNLYAAAGSAGNVYRLGRDIADNGRLSQTSGERIKPYVATGADHVLSLAIDRHDNLYIGTGDEGVLYKVTPDGHAAALFDARGNSITCLAVDSAGNLYCGTGPHASLYRIAADGTATPMLDHAPTFFTAMCVGADGSLYASSVTTLYRIADPAGPNAPAALPLENTPHVDVLTIAALPGGGVAAGSGNDADVFVSGQPVSTPTEGVYTSVVHDAHSRATWGAVRWDATVPASDRLITETRSGNSADPDATWSSWTPSGLTAGVTAEGLIASPPARFIQFRVRMQQHAGENAASISQPLEVRSVSISYLPRGQAPTVSFQSPSGGERWSGTQAVRWSASDSGSASLSYRLLYSVNDGNTWKPLPIRTAASGGSMETKDDDPVDGLARGLENQAGITDSLKSLIAESVQRKREAENDVAVHDTSETWDTAALPDGVYRLKVVASDHDSDPIDPQTAEAMSDPFVICNTPPAIAVSESPMIGADRSITVHGAASQSLIEVIAVQYRIDGGPWVAAAPRTGLFDRPRVEFAITTSPLTAGKHSVEIEAFNAAGKRSVQKIDVTAP